MSVAIACIDAPSSSAASSTTPAGLPPASPSGNALNRNASGIESSAVRSRWSHLTRIEAQPGQWLHQLHLFVRQVRQQGVCEQIHRLLHSVEGGGIGGEGDQRAVD